ncbi:MAG TPA: cytidine deaminase [Deinococcales bacterium]|nr:cytidine deaminase [Deinococcales bacterium]
MSDHDENWGRLRDAARAAFANAYAPYSRFQVGAALLTPDGQVFAGANIENASYGLGRCAEQSAVQAMASAGGRAFTRVYVYTEASPPSTPCGACRQVLYEFGPQAEVICGNGAGEERRWTVSELIPGAFGSRDLDA